MKLFRLTSRAETAFFDSDFNTQVEIPPDSQIALQSCSVAIVKPSIVVDSQNNGIQFQIADGVSRQLNLTTDQLYNTNILDLYLDMNIAFNGVCDYKPGSDSTNKILGIEWQVGQNTKKKTSIGYKKSQAGDYRTDWSFSPSPTQAVFTTTNNGTFGRKTGADGGSADSSLACNCLFPKFISRGNGFIRARVGVFTDNGGSADTNGMIIGLYSNFDAINEDFALEDIRVGIQCAIDGGGSRVYNLIVDGVITAIATTPNYVGNNNTGNDHLECAIDGNLIKVNIYQGGSSTPITVHSEPYVLLEKLAPFMVFNGERTTANFQRVRITPSPYDTGTTFTSTKLGDAGDTTTLTAPPGPNFGSPNDQNFLLFESIDLAEYLGYNNQRQPISGSILGREVDYISEFGVQLAQDADALIVELMNLNLDSYDSYSTTTLPQGGQRRNILSVIPSTNETGNIVYEPPYPTFLDLNNKDTLYLRNIKARVVRTDYSEVIQRGLGTLVFLIKPRTELK